MSAQISNAEKLRRKSMQDLAEQLEFVGSCEGGLIGKRCSELMQQIVNTAKVEGWDAFKNLEEEVT